MLEDEATVLGGKKLVTKNSVPGHPTKELLVSSLESRLGRKKREQQKEAKDELGYSVYLLYSFKISNTDTCGAAA
jgi:hypothetical protein